jgi:hypothetical protein
MWCPAFLFNYLVEVGRPAICCAGRSEPERDLTRPEEDSSRKFMGQMMHSSKLAGWILAAAMALAAVPGMAQQNDGPILLPKPRPVAKPVTPSATLLVICDLACNWKLDGKERGRIAAGDSASAMVELGEHIVIATTEDGQDIIQQIAEVKAAGQKVVILALQPVRAARLKAEQDARDKAAQEAKAEQEAKDKSEREAREKAEKEALNNAALQQQKKEHEEHEQAALDEATGLVWVDSATGLMWTKTDNGKAVDWEEATAYCRNLELAGHSDWRLPTFAELEAIYDSGAKVKCGYGGFSVSCHIMGSIRLSSPLAWSCTSGREAGKIHMISFYTGASYNYSESSKRGSQTGAAITMRALCVRSLGEGTNKRTR